MIRRHRVLTITCLLLVGCTSQQSTDNVPKPQAPQVFPDSIQLVFLTRDGCANTPLLLANLKAACESFDVSVVYEVVNQGALSMNDARVGYATPTILYDDHDLFGLTKPVPPFPAPS